MEGTGRVMGSGARLKGGRGGPCTEVGEGRCEGRGSQGWITLGLEGLGRSSAFILSVRNSLEGF